MRKSKEERIIEHGDYILKELHKVYLEGIGIDEYYKLLKEYKKLFRRFEKTIKLSDSMGSGIMEKNEILSDNLQYTIKTARTKLMDNVTEHRKTKEASSKYLEKLKNYEDALQNSYQDNAKLEKKLKYYIQNYGEVNHNFNEEVGQKSRDIQSLKLDINDASFKKMTIKQIISLEQPQDKSKYILSKITLKNFDSMVSTIEESSSIENFVLGTYRYVKNSFHKEDIIYHDKVANFYIITKDKNLNVIEDIMKKLNKKRKVLGFPIEFSIGITKFIDGQDSDDIFLRRCDKAFNEALKSPTNIVIK